MSTVSRNLPLLLPPATTTSSCPSAALRTTPQLALSRARFTGKNSAHRLAPEWLRLWVPGVPRPPNKRIY